jgi:AcrR family transcriptional regulator
MRTSYVYTVRVRCTLELSRAFVNYKDEWAHRVFDTVRHRFGQGEKILGMPTKAAEPVKTRERLSRDRILAAAIEMVDRDGLEDLSMRKLAAELDVSTMSLYNHVPNKDALLEGITETLLSEINLGVVDTEHWDEGLKIGFRLFRKVLLEHPHALPCVENNPVVTPDAFRPIELSLSLLVDAGFTPDEAMLAHWTLVGYTLGHVSLQVNNPLANQEAAEELVALKLRRLPAEEFPNLIAALPHTIGLDFGDAYEFGLDTVIAGFKARLTSRHQ